MLKLTVEGRAFYVRPERVIAIGEGFKTKSADGQEISTTLITVDGLGSVPVDEEVSVVLSRLGIETN